MVFSGSGHGNDDQGDLRGGAFQAGVEVGEGLDRSSNFSKIAWLWGKRHQTWSIPGRHRGDVERRCTNASRLGFYDGFDLSGRTR